MATTFAEQFPTRAAAKPAPHAVIQALAGTGKTTTLIEGVREALGKKSELTPSPQQRAVWDLLKEGPEVRSACFVSFNRSIAQELQSRVPEGCVAMTMHSLGARAVRSVFGNLALSEWRVRDIMGRILNRDIKDVFKENPVLVQATDKLVRLCKMGLVEFSNDMTAEEVGDILDPIASHYDVDLNDSRDLVYELVPQVLEACKDVNADRRMDYNDMIWLPVVLNLPLSRYPLLLVDESQDLNGCQQELAFRSGDRLVFCGDEHQAIYGFAGADAESMQRLIDRLAGTPAGVVVLPLTQTRRCGKAIVKEAQRIVEGFEAHETNGDGAIFHAAYDPDSPKFYGYEVQAGDMLLCRVNAPLVSQCFRFLKEGRKANIQGRDVGRALVSTIEKSKTTTAVELVTWIGNWLDAEQKKENAKKYPSDSRLMSLQDRHDCIITFCSGAVTVDQIITRIKSIFTDSVQPGINLSTIHKAKGLEAKRVYLLEPMGAGVPHPMAKSDWQVVQEWNLRYVAITRAIDQLVYVS